MGRRTRRPVTWRGSGTVNRLLGNTAASAGVPTPPAPPDTRVWSGRWPPGAEPVWGNRPAFPPPRPPGGDPPQPVPHALPETSRRGGHRRLVGGWIDGDPSRRHSVVLTRQTEAGALP